ncbi:MAG: cobalt-precorrin-5B (C(1))-methyltransferase CbiD [Cyanobacteria bacterium J06638_22]
MNSPRAGYTLPVFACASAIAALQCLRETAAPSEVTVNLVKPPETAVIPVEQAARLSPTTALAITRSDPGDNLDFTRDAAMWAMVELQPREEDQSPLELRGGEGIGRNEAADRQPAIYAYARKILEANLLPQLEPTERLIVTFIMPEGRSLAARTSNAAFGIVEGLSLLGTSGMAQPLSTPGQLEAFREELIARRAVHDGLVFCIGENGIHLAQQLGIPPLRIVKTANWLGSLLAEAGRQEVRAILLFGYHGKLMKLAAGIFHTHHHVADGRREVLTAFCAAAGLPQADGRAIFDSETAEDGLTYLRELDARTGSQWVSQVYEAIAQDIDHRAADYIRKHSDRAVMVGSLLFDRKRQIIVRSQIGKSILAEFC